MQGQLKRANIEYVVLAGSSLSFVSGAHLCSPGGVCVHVRLFVGRIELYVMWPTERWDNMILKEKWRSEC